MWKKYSRSSVYIPLALIICGISFICGAFSLEGDSRRYPLFVGVGLVVLSVIDLVTEILKINRETSGIEVKKEEKAEVFIPWYKSFTFCIAYAVSIWLVGFVISTFVCTFTCYQVLREKAKKKLSEQIIFTIIFTAVVYIVFGWLFHVRLPRGILWSLLKIA